MAFKNRRVADKLTSMLATYSDGQKFTAEELNSIPESYMLQLQEGALSPEQLIRKLIIPAFTRILDHSMHEIRNLDIYEKRSLLTSAFDNVSKPNPIKANRKSRNKFKTVALFRDFWYEMNNHDRAINYSRLLRMTEETEAEESRRINAIVENELKTLSSHEFSRFDPHHENISFGLYAIYRCAEVLAKSRIVPDHEAAYQAWLDTVDVLESLIQHAQYVGVVFMDHEYNYDDDFFPSYYNQRIF